MAIICEKCCIRLGLKDHRDVMSECHRKFCWGCGESSDSGLTYYPEGVLLAAANNKGILKNA